MKQKFLPAIFLIAIGALTVNNAFAEDYYSKMASDNKEFHIDNDEEKGGKDLLVQNATYTAFFTDGSVSNNNTCTKKDNWLECNKDGKPLMAAEVKVNFTDAYGAYHSCHFVLKGNDQRSGSICIDNPKFAVYENGPHNNTVNIGLSVEPKE